MYVHYKHIFKMYIDYVYMVARSVRILMHLTILLTHEPGVISSLENKLSTLRYPKRVYFL